MNTAQIFDLDISSSKDAYNVPICQDHLTQHSYFTHYATFRLTVLSSLFFWGHYRV
jgi:hypothetical protein